MNNSYELAKDYVQSKINWSETVLVAFDLNKSAKFLNDNPKEYLRFLQTQKLIEI